MPEPGAEHSAVEAWLAEDSLAHRAVRALAEAEAPNVGGMMQTVINSGKACRGAYVYERCRPNSPILWLSAVTSDRCSMRHPSPCARLPLASPARPRPREKPQADSEVPV